MSEQLVGQHSDEQMAIDNIARNILHFQFPGEIGENEKAFIEDVARGFLVMAQDEQLCTILPGLNKLEEVMSEREELRREVGDEAANLLASKKSKPMEEFNKENPDKFKDFSYFIESMDLPESEAEDHRAAAIREKAVSYRTEIETMASEVVKNDAEVLKVFEGHEAELHRKLEIDVQNSDTLTDFHYAQNLFAKVSQGKL